MEKQRIISIDVFRGLTMMLMILVNNPGDWGNVYPPLLHADWHGCTPTDLVFPFFVFIMGVAIPFSSGSSRHLGKKQFTKILGRSLRIICLGLFLNFFSKINIGGLEGISLLIIRLIFSGVVGYLLLGNFKDKVKLAIAFALFVIFIGLAVSGIPTFENVRIPGVLQRLGVVYFFAAIVFLSFSYRNQFIFGVLILVGYWLAMTYIDIPGFANYEKGTNLAAWVDALILKNHVWGESKPWDPEGILSTFPAIISCLIGTWVGRLMREDGRKKEVIYLGIGLTVVGLIWDQFFPINKALWTSSYVLYTAGLASLILVIFRFIFDDLKTNAIVNFFVMWGVNPIIIFFGAGILPRALNMIKINNTPLLSGFYKNGIVPIFSEPMNSSLVFALANVLFWSLVLYILNKKNLIIKV